MQELLNSMVRLSTAMTLFGVQQVQTAVGTADPSESVDKLRNIIDAMAEVVSSQIDQSKLPSLDGLANLDPREIVKNTADWLDGIVKSAAPAASEPKTAEDAFAAR